MSRRIDRRRFLQVSAGAAAAVVAYGALGAPGVRSRPEPSGPRRVLTKDFHLGPAELAEGSRAGLASISEGLRVGSGRDAGHVLSPVLKSELMFDYVGLFWSGLYPEDSSLAFWVRTSPDGRTWSPWETVQVGMPPGPRAQYDAYGALVWADRANYVQFLGEMRGAGKKPELHRVGLTLLNPYDGPVLEATSEPGDGGFAGSALAAEADLGLEANAAPAAVSGKPITFKREDWGADESLRFSGGQEIWPRSYVPTKKLVVHHTATSNSYATVEQAKATVRAIYSYHARSLGWGDIGYNSLVDRLGNSYEGRRGRSGPGYDGPGGREVLGEDVVAGHALAYNYGSSGIALLGTFCTPSECSGGSPTSAMISRLQDVLEWECRNHGINPEADSDFLLHYGAWDRNLRNVVGHRDVSSTTCPGGNVYALVPTLRSDTASRLADSSAPVVTITSAPAEGTPTNPNVSYSWQGNGGSGDKEYSYYLEGWSLDNDALVVYKSGFNAVHESAWGAWTTATQVGYKLLQVGNYTFHVRARDSQGRVSVYQDNTTLLADATTIPRWSGWENLGGVLNSGPDVSSWAEGRLDVFALDTANKLRHKWYAKRRGWSGWENLGAPSGLTLDSDPSAVSWGEDRIDVFVRASDGGLWHRWYVRGQGWSGWENLGGVLNSGPDVSTWAKGRLDVFALGTDDKLRHKWYVRGRGWSGWENLGAPSELTLASEPGAVSWGDGRIDVFARASDNGLWHRWYVRGKGWSGWEPLGGVLNSGPDVSSWAKGRLDVFALGTDDKLRHKWYIRGQGWFPQGPWENLAAPSGLTLTSNPGPVSWGEGRIDVFGRASDGGLWHKWYR